MSNTKAFSLIEVIVSLSIITIILSVVFYNYGGFNDRLSLNSSIQEMAVTIRQAQSYGINVRESAAGSLQFNYAYGIYFNTSSPTSYRIFIDSDSDNRYDDPGESIELVTLRNGVRISNACNNSTSGCTVPATATGINIMFQRPSPIARIYFTNSTGGLLAGGPVSFGKIQLSSPKGLTSYVMMESTGQIAIQ